MFTYFIDYVTDREVKLKKVLQEKGIDYSGKSDEEEESWDEDFADEEFEGGLKIPGAVWNRLFGFVLIIT